MGSKIARKTAMGVVLGVIIVLVVIFITYVLFPDLFDSFEAKTYDWRYQSKMNKLEMQRNGKTIDDIIIVDIDNRTLEKLGRFNQIPRSNYAQVIDYLSAAGTMVTAFDILFLERDVNSAVDDSFVISTKNAKNVCYAMSFSSATPDAFLYKMNEPPSEFKAEKFSFLFDEVITQHFSEFDRFDGKLFALYNEAERIGFANYQPDNDGIIRKMPLLVNFAGRQYPSLALSMVLFLFRINQEQIEIELGKAITLTVNPEKKLHIPIDNQARMLINYKGFYQTFRYVSFYDVYEKRIPPEFFKDRIVLIGASAAGLYDLRPVPFQNAFPGVEIHASIVGNLLAQDFIHANSKLVSIMILSGLILLVVILSTYPRLLIGGILTLVIASVFVFYTFFAFEKLNHWVENVRPILSITIAYVAVVTYRYVDELKDKKKIKGMFQHYISTSVVNELLKNPAMLKLGGERKIATSFFSDIKNFTTFSEQLPPEELITILNEYLSAMTDIVLKYEGYLDKYEGDAIVAIFGIPVEQDDHAVRACHAAIEMQHELVKLREKWKQESRIPFEARIGINSGFLIAGNIGGRNRFDYTAIGDSVNLASRLEGANKIYNTNIIISEDTFKQVNDKIWVRELDFIRVKGKFNPVRIYELLGRKSEKIDPVRSSCLEYFVQGLALYRQRDWVKAYDLFQKALHLVPDDGPSLEFIRRCKIFLEQPRTDDWDGVFDLRSK